MSQYEDFHRDWNQGIYEVKDSQNTLWKQVYLASLPSKFVEYIERQEVFQTYFETYTWGEIYCNVTKSFVGLCTSMKVNKSLQKLSRLPDSKSICSKYRLSIDDSIVQKRKIRKNLNKIQKQRTRNLCDKTRKHSRKGYYRTMPNTHYFAPKDIHLKSQRQQMITCWLCGESGHTTNKFPKGKESKENRGRKTQEQFLKITQRQVRRPLVQFTEEVHLMKQDCCSSPESIESSNSE